MKKSRPQAALLVCFHLRGSFPADLFTGGSNFLFLFSSDNRRQRSYPCRTAWFRCFPTYNATTAFSLPRSQLRQDRVLRLQQSPVRRVLAGCFALRLPFDYQSARRCSKTAGSGCTGLQSLARSRSVCLSAITHAAPMAMHAGSVTRGTSSTLATGIIGATTLNALKAACTATEQLRRPVTTYMARQVSAMSVAGNMWTSVPWIAATDLMNVAAHGGTRCLVPRTRRLVRNT